MTRSPYQHALAMQVIAMRLSIGFSRDGNEYLASEWLSTMVAYTAVLWELD